jgi:protein-S-isoprenylcysteine O-methyltransferase Ste14
MKRTHLLAHLRDIIILPFTVSVCVPYLLYNEGQSIIPDHIILKSMGGVILLSGGMLFFYTVFLFDTIGKGTLAPWAAPQQLVVAGPYKHCRNPMITGVFFILLGEAFVFHSTNILLWAGVFFLINTLYFRWKEEPALYERFGEDYLTYKKNVPRWMPRWKPYELKT